MKYLIYMSTSIRLLSDAELKQLLRQCQANNAINDLSGMLLYSEGSFVQVLEGAAKDLDAIYEKIKNDRRHKNIIQLAKGNLNERLFPSWSMGFKAVSADEFSRFDAYIDPKDDEIWKRADLHPATSILKVFAETNRF